jgi:SAM-dependent methyltransferase
MLHLAEKLALDIRSMADSIVAGRKPIRQEEVFCLICNGIEARIIERDLRDFEYNIPGAYQLRECRHCSQLYLSPRPIEEDIVECYPADYHGYQTKSVSRLYDLLTSFQMRHRFRRYKRLVGDSATILDVGCGNGSVMKALKRTLPSWEVFGVEFQPEVARLAQEQGLRIFSGTLEECTFPEASFDILIMNHLIEHLPDPLRALKRARDLLKRGGYIIGEVPNFDSLDRSVAGKWWGGHHAPRHLFQFTPKTLDALFRRAGLKTLSISPEMHTGHWAGSVQNFLQDGHLPMRLHNGRAPYYPLLLVLFTIPNFFQVLLKKTGIISFIAQRSR